MFFDMNAPSPHVPIAQKLARNCRESKIQSVREPAAALQLTRCASYHLEHVTVFKRVFGEAGGEPTRRMG
jgi:hypothetical protein